MLQNSDRMIKKISFGLRLDYLGISFVMMTAGSVFFYYGFYDSHFYQQLYIWLFCIYCTLSLLLTYLERFSDPDYHILRAILFLLEGFFGKYNNWQDFGLKLSFLYSAFVPLVHLFLNTLSLKLDVAQQIFKSMQLLLLAGISNLVGAIIYIYKVPERLKQGLFDISFNSHQLFHVHHIIAAIIYYHGIVIMASVHIDQSYANNKNNVYIKLNNSKN